MLFVNEYVNFCNDGMSLVNLFFIFMYFCEVFCYFYFVNELFLFLFYLLRFIFLLYCIVVVCELFR